MPIDPIDPPEPPGTETKPTETKPARANGPSAVARQTRLSTALRANLRRRKDQARARTSDGEDFAEPEAATGQPSVPSATE